MVLDLGDSIAFFGPFLEFSASTQALNDVRGKIPLAELRWYPFYSLKPGNCAQADRQDIMKSKKQKKRANGRKPRSVKLMGKVDV